MAHLGCPVVGDKVYGARKDNNSFPRQLLHASRLVFHHPTTGFLLDKRAELWTDFRQVLLRLGGSNVVGD
jgi:23S rRNA pseudouridine1911/1915/1917 synthase